LKHTIQWISLTRGREVWAENNINLETEWPHTWSLSCMNNKQELVRSVDVLETIDMRIEAYNSVDFLNKRKRGLG